MDAQGRRRAGDIDPADQWVLNPDTGSYELRLNPAPDSPRSAYGGARSHAAPRPRAPEEPSTRTGDEDDEDRAERPVPPQRSRRAGSAPPPGRGRRKPKPKPSRKQQALRWGGGALGLVLVVGCVGGYLLYQHFNGNINKVDVGIDNPAVSDGPINILLIGTDARTGKGNQGYGDSGSVGHADTTLLFHVSKDRSNATVLSIPRDLITDIPDCPTKQKDGSTKLVRGQQGVRFNISLGQDGRDPGCTWRTVQEMTGVEINHFMMADFNAVKELTSAVGGVEVCVAKDVNDPKSHLRLTAGRHTIEGEQALAFVRTRKSIGNSSDLDRIKLQQQFLGSMIRKMKSSDTLTDPGKLFDLANVATKALTVDSNIGTVSKLMDLAKDLRRINTENITFATVPVLDNPAERIPSTVVLNEAQSGPLFKMISADKSLTKTGKDKKKPGGEKAKKVPASEVRVDVMNGGGPVGSAQGTVSWLQNTEGVPLSTNAGNAPASLTKTRLEYAPNQAGQAATLAEMMGLPASALKKSGTDAAADEPMKLTLGEDFTAPGEPIDAPDEAPEGVQRVNAGDKNICAQ